MLYQPTNISPSMLGPLGNGVVDANEDFIISWQVNGNSPMTAFRIQIYANNSASTEVYDSGKITDGCPFYGTDYAGNQNLFSYEANAALENGNSYKLVITQWWNVTESVRQQAASAFITRTTPVVEFTEIPEGYDPGPVTFYAKYTQEQGDTLNWVRWQIASIPEEWAYDDDVGDIIADTGNIYGTSQLQYTFSGALPDAQYAVRCMIQTESGAESDTEWDDFRTYSSTELEGEFYCCADVKSNGVRVTIPEGRSIPGEVNSGSIEIDNYELHLSDHSSVRWWQRKTPIATAPFYLVWGGKIDVKASNTTVGFWLGDFPRGGVHVYFDFDKFDVTEEGAYSISETGAWRTIVYGRRNSRLYMALGDAGVAYSSDAKTWTLATIPTDLSQNISALSLYIHHGVYKDTFFLASDAANTAAYSEDGVTWTTITMQDKVTGAASVGGYLYVSYADGSIYRSDEFYSWQEVTIDGYTGTAAISGIEISDDGVAVLLREDSMLAISTDLGETWTLTGAWDKESRKKYYGLCYGNGTFFYRDSSGYRYTSKDGEYWTVRISSGAFNKEIVSNTVFGGGVFMAGGNGKIVISEDGKNWYTPGPTVSENLLCGCYDSHKFIFVGGGNATIIDTCKTVHLYNGRTEVCSVKIYAEYRFSLCLDGEKLYYLEDYGNTIKSVDAALPFTEEQTLAEISLNSYQVCEFITVTTGTNYSESSLRNLMAGDVVQDAEEPLQFYTHFANGLNGGQYGTTGYGKFAIYRQDGDNELLHHVGDISVEEGNVLIDASATNGEQYTYYAYGLGYNSSSYFVGEPIRTCGWDWYLMACAQDDAGAYHVQRIFRFANNLSSGSVSNNAGPSILQNFTRYPTVQNSPWNYRSGTLTSLIGYTADGKYYDTRELRDEIAALTTSDYALFLKNRKGDVIRIAVSGAVEMETMDNSASQAQTMKLPWTEIGDASDAQIIITKNDGAYLQAIPSPVVGGYCDCGNGAAKSFAYPLTVLQSSGTTVYDWSEAKKIVIKGDGGSGEVVAEDDGNGNITIY